jgi:hypothetical protein
VARRTEDFEIDQTIVPIDDGADTSAAAVDTWLASLHDDEPVKLAISAATIVRDMRERGEA